jgi:hypothetical protein
MRRMRPRLSYANIAATLALFFAVSTGTVYAVNEWTGANIVNDSLTGRDIRETTLGIVPNADKLDGISANGFVRGGRAAGAFGNSTGKSYINRIETANDGIESTLLSIPGFFKLVGSCYTSGGSTYALLEYRPLVAGVDVWYEVDNSPAAHPGALPINGALQSFTTAARRVTYQVGDGVGTQSGQRLATMTAFFGRTAGECFFQVSALVQTT